MCAPAAATWPSLDSSLPEMPAARLAANHKEIRGKTELGFHNYNSQTSFQHITQPHSESARRASSTVYHTPSAPEPGCTSIGASDQKQPSLPHTLARQTRKQDLKSQVISIIREKSIINGLSIHLSSVHYPSFRTLISDSIAPTRSSLINNQTTANYPFVSRSLILHSSFKRLSPRPKLPPKEGRKVKHSSPTQVVTNTPNAISPERCTHPSIIHPFSSPIDFLYASHDMT